MGLTTKNTLDSVQKLFDSLFEVNSVLDRQVYLLDIKFNLPAYQEYIHENHAHLMLSLADEIQDFGSLRDDLFYRGEIPINNKDYKSVVDLTQDYLEHLFYIEKLCSEAIKCAIANGDIMYEDFLRNFQIENIAILVKQVSIFYKAISEYEKNGILCKWNNDFWSFVIMDKGGDE